MAFQIPPSLFCSLGIQRKILEFKVVVTLLMPPKKENIFQHSSKSGYAFLSEEVESKMNPNNI